MATEEDTCPDCGKRKDRNYSRCLSCQYGRDIENYAEWMDYN